MHHDSTFYYKALTSRDPRFDGVFFVGVTSTGIYCRPICPARTPKPANCRFFDSPQAAEKAGFRPCLRCRPELAPGNAPVDDSQRIAHLLAERIEEGLVDAEADLETIAAQFELSSRQIRRIVQKEMGVSPIALLQSRRLLLAKQLLTETVLPITEIAFASGFSSLRRFNDAFLARYRMPPTHLRRKAAAKGDAPPEAESSTLRLTYRAPYDWAGVLAFLTARMLKGVEWISDDSYARTVCIGRAKGWIRVRHVPKQRTLLVEFSHTLTPVLPALMTRLRHLFDLAARPDVIAAHLGKSTALKKQLARNPGLRVPGAFDGFELAVRAILGQLITVKAATTLTCRFVDAFGEKIATPVAGLSRLSPRPEKIARLTVDDIAKLGIVAARAASIIALAKAYVSGKLDLSAGARPEAAIAQLAALPGVGPWTAHYIAMRALRWPDAFPKEDVAVRKSLGGVTAQRAEELSQAWRPWRSYAVLHLWNGAAARSARSPS
jgi:AraC family transcriptional regulator of adaptative response / DNA-3-methyladenine glycosylase II